MTLAELMALDADELKTMSDRAERAFAKGERVNDDDLAASAILLPDIYDVRAGPDGMPEIRLVQQEA